MKFSLLILMFSVFSGFSQTERTFDNGHGGKITLPYGNLSFADSVVSFKAGIPTPAPQFLFPEDAIGLPDFKEEKVKGFVSLGIGGELVLAFKDNALINIPGIDLYVFEVGRYIEETILYVSKDLQTWLKVGKINGGNASVDLGDSIPSSELFRYVKLVDARTTAHSGDRIWPGADIDAVAAVGSAKQISLDALYLFEVNKAQIKQGAKKELDSLVTILKQSRDFHIVIEGHTDSTGTRENNLRLSLSRAESIKNYLAQKLPYKPDVEVFGRADLHPVASNRSAEGRQRNRRVEIYFLPKNKAADNSKTPPAKKTGK